MHLLLVLRQGRQQKPLANNGDGGMASAPINQNQQVTGGQQVLQSLASRGSAVSRMNASDAPERQTAPAIGQVRYGRTLGAQGPVDQVDMGSVMSQVLHSRVLICVVIAGLVPCAVTICVVIVGLVPCAAQEIERFSEDTRNKRSQHPDSEMAKSQGITVSLPAQQQGSKNVQTGRPQNILTLSLTKGNTTYDEFKHGFPSDGLSTASNKWWESNSPDGYESIHGEGAETDEDKKHQSEKLAGDGASSTAVDKE